MKKKKLSLREEKILCTFSSEEIVYHLKQTYRLLLSDNNHCIKNFEASMKEKKHFRNFNIAFKKSWNQDKEELQYLKNDSKNYRRIINLLDKIKNRKLSSQLQFVLSAFGNDKLLDWIMAEPLSQINSLRNDIESCNFELRDIYKDSDLDVRKGIPMIKNDISKAKTAIKFYENKLKILINIGKLMKDTIGLI